MHEKAIAILPARGGSKRIPRKNILDFHGKPAIGWPIQAAQQSACFDRVIVTTDDAEIARVSQTHGAEVPFLRDSTLADDFTGTTDVIRDAVEKLNLPPKTLVCCIYPTALFLSGDDLARGKDQLTEDVDWVLSLGEYATPIDRAYRMIDATERVAARHPEKMPMRSQDLEPAYFDAGQFYWARAETWLDKNARVWDGAASVILPPERCIDIDTPTDWRRAEHQFALLEMEKNASSHPD
ncbi:pseudaminic acid cytidylyltransferase [Falsihalocynthiibacter sp. S25ZX9]|uniref:pseudaminic acid cytidylyltransferase n=1 Tax=Falsihalocynthiibacter sp. S25ZX9 TaxID=3240870 RepID=UPI00350FE444